MPSYFWIAVWAVVIAAVCVLLVRDWMHKRSQSSAEARRDAERGDLVNKGTVLRSEYEPGSAPGVFGPG